VNELVVRRSYGIYNKKNSTYGKAFRYRQVRQLSYSNGGLQLIAYNEISFLVKRCLSLPWELLL
jgi:hypothetical protein